MFARKYFIYFILICIIAVSTFLLFRTDTPTVESETVNAGATLPISATNPFVILVVPGHDTTTGGASFKNIYERDLVVEVADDIASLFAQDPKYKIIVARDKQVWNPILANYFTDNHQAILDFKNTHQAAYKLLVASGQEKVIPNPAPHTLATKETSLELYGINKWANESKVNLIIHLHFNNSTRRNVKLPGPRSGFDMFIPEKQSINAVTSRTIAQDIYNELRKKFLPEAPGYYHSLFEDQTLIALGASNTLTKPAILIEYAYIYEKIIQTTEAKRKQTLEQMAEQTVAGIQDYVSSL